MLIHELTHKPAKINEDLASFFGLNNPAVKQAWDQIGGELIQDLSARFTKDPRYANMPLEQRKKAIAQDQAVQQIAQQKNEEWQKYITALETKSRGTPLTDQQYQAAFLNWANRSMFGNKFSSLDSAVKAKAQEYFTQFVSHRGDPDPKRRSMFQTNILASLVADETARAVQVATDLQKTQAALAAQQPAAPEKSTGTAMPTAPYQVPGAGTNPNPTVTKPGQTATTPSTGMPAGVPQPTTSVSPTVGGASKPGLPTPAEIQKFNQLVAKAAKA